MKPKIAPEPQEGVLKFRDYAAATVYTLTSDARRKMGKGSVTADPERLRDAFRSGDATLQLADGRDLRIMLVAHSEGGSTAWFEIAA